MPSLYVWDLYASHLLPEFEIITITLFCQLFLYKYLLLFTKSASVFKQLIFLESLPPSLINEEVFIDN